MIVYKVEALAGFGLDPDITDVVQFTNRRAAERFQRTVFPSRLAMVLEGDIYFYLRHGKWVLQEEAFARDIAPQIRRVA